MTAGCSMRNDFRKGDAQQDASEPTPPFTSPLERLQHAEVDPGTRVEPPVRAEDAIRHEGVQVRVEGDQVPEGLDGDDHAGDGPRIPHRPAVHGLQGIMRTLAELPEEPAILAEVHSEELGNGEDIISGSGH